MGSYSAIIDIVQITEGFYPSVYLLKNELEVTDENEVKGLLLYPSMYIYDFAFAQNFTSQLYNTEFSYSFSDTADENIFSYYTMAVYGSSWGMSGEKKPEYLITVTVTDVALSDANPNEEEFMLREDNL